jgi:hypothetical protein
MGTYIQIGSTVTVGAGGASSIDFTSIPSTYTDLVVKMSLRDNHAAISDSVRVSFNSSLSNQSQMALLGDGSSGSAGTNGSAFYITTGTNANNATTNTFSNAELYIPNYAGSAYKSYSAEAVTETNATNASMALTAGLWSNTAAITSISFTPAQPVNFLQYSTASLYGIKKD